ncbi:four helix bundle protein [Clostridium aestuarii]|uniref:Four helix bundle protein n=1 Tax=Clostridium aestuarii TaxID=338193 RepID=A0ABT4D075_9CLOT|nr:four helix bundle protein [Clostridium aestuarii]MCY6484497.1 four helix bundle protein [Clostridium aestuarii]
MRNLNNSIVYKNAFNFSIRMIELYKYLCAEKKEYILSKQIVRSGTSIGANIREGLDAQSDKDFLSKFNIALKEAVETDYWIELLVETKFLTQFKGKSLINDLHEIIRMLNSIVKTTKQKINYQTNTN